MFHFGGIPPLPPPTNLFRMVARWNGMSPCTIRKRFVGGGKGGDTGKTSEKKKKLKMFFHVEIFLDDITKNLKMFWNIFGRAKNKLKMFWNIFVLKYFWDGQKIKSQVCKFFEFLNAVQNVKQSKKLFLQFLSVSELATWDTTSKMKVGIPIAQRRCRRRIWRFQAIRVPFLHGSGPQKWNLNWYQKLVSARGIWRFQSYFAFHFCAAAGRKIEAGIGTQK